MPIPYEVHYRTFGLRRKKEREVIGVICPSAISQYLGLAPRPIFVSMGDVIVDWTETSAGFEAMMNLTSNAAFSGAPSGWSAGKQG